MALSRTRTSLSTPKLPVLLDYEEMVLLIRALEDLIGDDTAHKDPDALLAHQLISKLYNIASGLVKLPERAN